MSTSYLETVRASWTTELETIVAGATYRNTVAEVYQEMRESFPAYPSIVFLLGQGTLKAKNDAWSLYDLYIPFFVICEIKADSAVTATSTLVAAQDSLLHDVMRVIATLYTKNITAASGPKWNIQNDPPVMFTPVFPTGENVGEFVLYGTLHIRNLDSSFDD